MTGGDNMGGARSMSETGWQPIETAPKDGGSDILVYVEESGEQFVAFYDREMWVYALRPSGSQTCCEATHWMPLPPPPGDDRTIRFAPPFIRQP